MPSVPSTTIAELIARYDALLDSYGVLTDNASALPGARELIDHLNATGKPFWVVTNDASRTPGTSARRFRRLGLAIDADRVITSGSLLAAHFAGRGLRGARTLVLGTQDSEQYVRDAGGVVVAPSAGESYDAIVVADDDGYDFLPTVNIALSVLYRQLDRGDDLALVLPNPDIVYPAGDGRYGFTAGGVALLLEAALDRRYPRRGLRFARLGKPHPPMYAEAERRAGTRNLVMIGDQLETDIAGAAGYGIDSALLTTGVSRWDDDAAESAAARPTWLLADLRV